MRHNKEITILKLYFAIMGYDVLLFILALSYKIVTLLHKNSQLK